MTLIPRVRLVQFVVSGEPYYTCVLSTSVDGDVEQVALGGGPTRPEAIDNARQFVAALSRTVEALPVGD